MAWSDSRLDSGVGGLPTVGVVAIGRPTFDIDAAAPVVTETLATVRSIDPSVVGDDAVRTSTEEIKAAVEHWPDTVQSLIIVFATFADSTLPAAAVEALSTEGRGHPSRLVLWSLPEPRREPRLIWNSLCGSILATYRFRNESIDVRSIHRSPLDVAVTDQLRDALTRDPDAPETQAIGADVMRTAETEAEADRVVAAMTTARVGIVGTPPDGFEPCEIVVPPTPIGAQFEHIDLADLFTTAERTSRRVDDGTPVALRGEVDGLVNIDARRPDAVRQSLRLHDALGHLADEQHHNALAVRCWPECFTTWGGAACAPLSFLSDAGLPAACEADAYGALTCLLLDTIGGRAAFLADVVDIDREANTCDVWHCGVAPRSMADPTRPVVAIDHPNRGIPLALQFGLAPGPVTVCRISQSGGRLRLVVGFGQAIDRPPPFAGTSGTIQFQIPVDRVIRRIADEGLEHHLVVAAGDHRAVLAAVAERWGMPLLLITP